MSECRALWGDGFLDSADKEMTLKHFIDSLSYSVSRQSPLSCTRECSGVDCVMNCDAL